MRKLTDDSPSDESAVDSRELAPALVGTRLRDAAVNPEPGDFLEPTNAGEADPHGPEVVNPELHASQGVRPVKPGNVGDESTQDDAEPAHAEQLQTPTETGAEQVTDAEQPAGNASRSEWFDYAVSTGHHRDSLEDFTRDEIRDLFK